MTKKFVALFMVMTLVMSFAACGNSENQNSTISNSNPPSQSENSSDSPSQNETPSVDTAGNRRILIAYFAVAENSEVDAISSASVVTIDNEAKGLTKALADMIAEETNGDLFSIQTNVDYPAAINELIDYASEEQNNNVRPELTTSIEHIDEYDTIFVAYLIQENLDADIFRIEPKTPYPVDHDILTDLAKEEQDSNARPELSASVENIDQYDVIFVGYPNWWADMPMPLYTFLEEYDLSGKTIIPFNTHGGSGFSNTIDTIAGLQPNATVEQNGFTVSRDSADSCEDDVIAWLQDLNLAQ